MKLIEPTQRSTEKDRIQMLVDRVGKLLKLGNSDEQAEDALLARFMRGLDNRFFMLRNLQLEGTGGVFQPILIGPTGLFVINVSRAKGFFKAKDDAWWEMNKSTHKFGPARPNLLRQSKEYAQKLAQILEAHEKSHPEIMPILVFANPGVHIESSNPIVRIVLMDGVESLIDSIVNNNVVLQDTEVEYLADSLEIMSNPEKAIPLGEGEDFFGRDLLLSEEKKPPRKLPDISIPTNLPLPPVDEKLKLTRKQWLILEVLLGLTIVVLLGAIIIVLKFL